MGAQSLDGVQPWLVDHFIACSQQFSDWTGQWQIVPTITSGYRTIAEQQDLWDHRATNPYPVNYPGDSAHNWGLAIDSWVPDPWFPYWTWFRRSWGFTVPDNDRVHSEYPNWRDLVRAAGYTLPSG